MTAKLTKAENKFWTKVFEHAVNSGQSVSRADSEAWIALKREFPRLRKFDGCKP